MVTVFAFFLLAINLLLTVLVTIAFMTLLERKIIAGTQNRKGPNRVGLFGILQPISDALKLIFKETVLPRNSKVILFLLSPMISLIFALLGWAVIPINFDVILSDLNLAVFVLFSISVLHVYGIVLAGWSSGSRYSFIGAMRSSAQLLAYDLIIGLCFVCLVLYTRSLNIVKIVEIQEHGWLIFYLFPIFVIFFICSLAETNRHPFDLPEAESELVGGYFTEYSSAPFALFYLGEYGSIMLMCTLITDIFLGGWLAPSFLKGTIDSGFFWFALKLAVLYYIFVLIRAAIPRYRYDQLMRIGWKFCLPAMLAFTIYVLSADLFICRQLLEVSEPEVFNEVIVDAVVADEEEENNKELEINVDTNLTASEQPKEEVPISEVKEKEKQVEEPVLVDNELAPTDEEQQNTESIVAESRKQVTEAEVRPAEEAVSPPGSVTETVPTTAAPPLEQEVTEPVVVQPTLPEEGPAEETDYTGLIEIFLKKVDTDIMEWELKSQDNSGFKALKQQWLEQSTVSEKVSSSNKEEELVAGNKAS